MKITGLLSKMDKDCILLIGKKTNDVVQHLTNYPDKKLYTIEDKFIKGPVLLERFTGFGSKNIEGILTNFSQEPLKIKTGFIGNKKLIPNNKTKIFSNKLSISSGSNQLSAKKIRAAQKMQADVDFHPSNHRIAPIITPP